MATSTSLGLSATFIRTTLLKDFVGYDILDPIQDYIKLRIIKCKGCTKATSEYITASGYESRTEYEDGFSRGMKSREYIARYLHILDSYCCDTSKRVRFNNNLAQLFSSAESLRNHLKAIFVITSIAEFLGLSDTAFYESTDWANFISQTIDKLKDTSLEEIEEIEGLVSLIFPILRKYMSISVEKIPFKSFDAFLENKKHEVKVAATSRKESVIRQEQNERALELRMKMARDNTEKIERYRPKAEKPATITTERVSDNSILVFGNLLPVSKSFYKMTKLTKLSSNEIDIGEELFDVIYEGYMATTDPVSPTFYENLARKKIIATLKLLDSYYAEDNEERALRLKPILTTSTLRLDKYGAIQNFVNIVIPIVDFLEVDDRLLIDISDWIDTLKELSNELKFGIRPETLTKENWRTMSKTDIMKYGIALIDRYITPGNIKVANLGEKVLKHQRELQSDRFSSLRNTKLQSRSPFIQRLRSSINQENI